MRINRRNKDVKNTLGRFHTRGRVGVGGPVACPVSALSPRPFPQHTFSNRFVCLPSTWYRGQGESLVPPHTRGSVSLSLCYQPGVS